MSEFLEKMKIFFMVLGKNIARFVRRTYKKLRKAVRRYIRLLVRHTKAKDYSVLIYTIAALVALILIIVLFANLVGGKDSKKDKKKTTETATITDAATIEDPEIAAMNALKQQAQAIYQADSSMLMLVNINSPLAEDYTFTHKTLLCGQDIDERIFENLKNMLQACNDAGNEYNIVLGYVDRQTQQAAFDNQVSSYTATGLSEEEARAQAMLVAFPGGCNEHETGLALDITDLNTHSYLEYNSASGTDTWLLTNCFNYGFIQRYPADKAAWTGVSNEAWQFRYVGIDAAKFMHDNNLCLEEFINLLNQ